MEKIEESPFTVEELLLRDIAVVYDGLTPNRKSVRVPFQGKTFLLTVREVS